LGQVFQPNFDPFTDSWLHQAIKSQLSKLGDTDQLFDIGCQTIGLMQPKEPEPLRTRLTRAITPKRAHPMKREHHKAAEVIRKPRQADRIAPAKNDACRVQ